MSEAPQAPKASKYPPIMEYIYKTYLAEAKMPQGAETVKAGALIGEIAKIQGDKKIKDKTAALIEFKRKLTPFQKFILDCTGEFNRINADLAKAIAEQNADEMSRGYFRITALILKLKLYKDSTLPVEKFDPEITFTNQEMQFMDTMLGVDEPFDPNYKPAPPPIVSTRIAQVDKRQLVKDAQVVDEDYEEPLRIAMRDYIKNNFGIERLGDFSGTKKPLPPLTIIKPAKVREEVEDMTCFRTPSQFFTWKYRALRRATYRPLDIERKETGGYRQRRVSFKEENGALTEVPKSMISVEIHFMDANTIFGKMVGDVSYISQTLSMGAKKVDNDYFFNTFYYIQQPFKIDGEEAAPVEITEKAQRFDPSRIDDPIKRRDKISAEKALELINELAKIDMFIFGGNLDLDAYLDGIGIRKKPNVMMIEGEGLAAYDYINNLMIIPTFCPPRISALEHIVSVMADFRYALWIDSPKNIFDQQGVGFQIIGSKSRSGKPLWSVFPTKCSALIKQRAFRDYYKRHILSCLCQGRVKAIAGYEIPMTYRIADSKLRQFFDAYVKLGSLKAFGGKAAAQPAEGPDEDSQEAEQAEQEAPAKEAAPAPAQKPTPAPAAPTPAPKPAPAPTPPPPPPKPAAPPPKPAPAPEPTPAPDCKSCGQPLPPNSKFCLNCGTPVELASVCPGCGAELPAGSKFCNVCGTKVG